MERSGRERARAQALELYQAGLAAADPRAAVRRALSADPPPRGVRLLALGKAAEGMAAGAADALPERIGPALIVAPQGTPELGSALEARRLRGGHPLPDQASLDAGAALRDWLSEPHPTLVLLSGGASACVESPADGVTLEQLRAVHLALLASGLDIARTNAVRMLYSQLKCGRLLPLLNPEDTWLLAIPDVPDDELAILASGPLHGDQTLLERGRAIAGDLGLSPPSSIPPAGPRLAAERSRVVLSLVEVLEAMAEAGRVAGLEVTLERRRLDGDAALLGQELGTGLRAAGTVLVAGGETTVTLPDAPGRGGRCQQLALAAAREIRGSEAVLLAAGSDGEDGEGGDEGPIAGAVVDGGTWERIAAAGLDPAAALAEADAGRALAAAGDLVDVGATGTNVGDLIIAFGGARP